MNTYRCHTVQYNILRVKGRDRAIQHIIQSCSLKSGFRRIISFTVYDKQANIQTSISTLTHIRTFSHRERKAIIVEWKRKTVAFQRQKNGSFTSHTCRVTRSSTRTNVTIIIIIIIREKPQVKRTHMLIAKPSMYGYIYVYIESSSFRVFVCFEMKLRKTFEREFLSIRVGKHNETLCVGWNGSIPQAHIQTLAVPCSFFFLFLLPYIPHHELQTNRENWKAYTNAVGRLKVDQIPPLKYDQSQSVNSETQTKWSSVLFSCTFS